MNTLESYTTLSPSGKEDECAKFTITDTTSPFVLSEIMTVDQQYALSFWVKSETPGQLTVEDIAFNTTAEWKQHSAVFFANKKNLKLYFTTASTYYIYHPQLEIGNKVTDWAPAPEDTSDEIVTYVEGKSTSILSEAEGIYLEALKEYVLATSFNDLKTYTESELSLLSDELGLKFTQSTEKTDKVNTDLQDMVDTLTKWFTFEVDGLTISQSNSPFKVVIDNDQFSMFVNDVEFLWLKPNEADGSNIPRLKVTEKLNLFGYQMTEDSEGRVNEVYVGY